MFLSNVLHKQRAKASLVFILSAFYASIFILLFSAEGRAASAMRSRVYGFRNTDNKEAMQLVGRLGFKVTIDAHSSSVVVLTGDDAEELTRAYSLMEIADQKESVVMKVLALIPDSKAEEVIDALHSQLKNCNIGTLLNPPAKAVAEPLIADIYQGELIAIAAESKIGTIEEAYKNLQKKESLQQPKVSEPNTSESISPELPVAVEPNAAAAPGIAAEPNLIKSEAQAVPREIKPITVEPNEPVVQETAKIEPVEVSVPAETVEPNKAEPQEPQTQEDFISDELLKALDTEEKKIEAQKAAAMKTAPAEATEVPTPMPELKEITGDEFKKIVAQLMKQAAEEEKKATAQELVPSESSEKSPLTQIPPVSPEEEPVQKTEQPEVKTQAVVPAETEVKPQKAETPQVAARTQTEKTPAWAQEKAKPAETKPEIDKGEEELELTITLPEKVEVKQLIELVGKQLGLNYIYDETKIKGEVTLKVHDGKIRVKDCYTLLETVLRFKGFIMTRRGNLVTIVPSAELTFSDPKIRTPDEPIEAGDVFINSVFTFKHAKSSNVQNILRSLNLGTNVIPIPESNSLIVSDYSYRMDKIDQIIRILDVPGVPKTYTYRSLQYMQASELIPRLQNLATQMQNLTITSDTSSASTPMPTPTPAPAGGTAPTRVNPQTGRPMTGGMPGAAGSSTPVQEQTVYLDADERTNRILMIGNEEQLKMVNDLIDSLDVRQYNLRFVKEYEIKNVDASEVINVLNELGLASVASTATSAQTSRQTATQPTRPGQPVRPGTQPQQTIQPTASQASVSPDQPSISIRPNTNSLLVNATVEQHEDIELVISYIDVEQKDQRTIQEYEIQNVDAREIVQTLGDLSIISKDSVSNITSSKSSMYDSSAYGSRAMGRGGRSGYSSQQQPYPQQGVMTPEGGQEQTVVVSLPTASGETIRELITTEPQISILESTNSLLIYATPRQHASVALVIAHVDREMDRATAPYVVYPLENQDPEELAATLTDLIEGTMKRAASASATGQPGVGPTPDSRIQTEQTQSILPKKEEELIRIIPDVKSYSLIVYANKKNQQWIAALIKQLDQYRPQVLLDCTLVSITRDDEFKFDLDMISKKYSLGTSLTQLMNPITGGTSTAITPTNGTALEGTVSYGAGSAFYGDDNIQALLELTDKKGYGRVLGRPSILVKDNEEGVIKAENVKYVAQYSSSTVSSENLPTTSTNVTFTDYPTGITLTITPHIASEKLMQLEIELDRKDLDPADSSGGVTTVQGQEYPKPLDTVSSNIKTWSIVPSGATIILGGIETINQTKGVDKVPLLGDIPLVGLLFRGVSQTDNQSRLYIFVKANIIKAGDELTGDSDIERISQKKRQAFEDDETNFQEMEALPGPKPNPMSPIKILEDDEYIQKLKEQQKQGNVITVPIN